MKTTITRRTLLKKSVAAVAATAFVPELMISIRTAAAGTKDHQVEIRDFSFAPASIEVSPGDTITWTNHDIAPHTATAKDKSWDTGIIRKGESKSHLVTSDMTGAYYCRFHPNMKAQISLA